jgi:hypothetical protein
MLRRSFFKQSRSATVGSTDEAKGKKIVLDLVPASGRSVAVGLPRRRTPTIVERVPQRGSSWTERR